MTIINMNRLLEDNGFVAKEKPNNYSKVFDGKRMVRIEISTSEKKFRVGVYESKIGEMTMFATEKFHIIATINKFIVFVNSFYGMNIPLINPKSKEEE